MVADIGEGLVGRLPGIQPHANQNPHHRPMARQPALPDGEDFPRVGEVERRVVKQHMPQPRPQHRPGDDIQSQIVSLVRRTPLPAVHPAEDRNAVEEGGREKQAVPAHGQMEIPEIQGEGDGGDVPDHGGVIGGGWRKLCAAVNGLMKAQHDGRP